MGTTSTAPSPKTFLITLNLVRGVIEAHGDFENQRVVNDIVRFANSVPGSGDIVITFTSRAATTRSGSAVPADLLPFGVATIKNPNPSQEFKVMHSCKSMMSITINTADGRKLSCAWDAEGKVQGTNICTGGGTSPVKCP
jgi:hypothetical protein